MIPIFNGAFVVVYHKETQVEEWAIAINDTTNNSCVYHLVYFNGGFDILGDDPNSDFNLDGYTDNEEDEVIAIYKGLSLDIVKRHRDEAKQPYWYREEMPEIKSGMFGLAQDKYTGNIYNFVAVQGENDEIKIIYRHGNYSPKNDNIIFLCNTTDFANVVTLYRSKKDSPNVIWRRTITKRIDPDDLDREEME